MPIRHRKLPLRDCVASGADGVLFYCNALGCGHEGQMDMAVAIGRWGEDRRLDELRVVCSVCGGRDIDVRPRWPATGPGGQRLP